MNPEAFVDRIESSARTRWTGHEHDTEFERRLRLVLAHGARGAQMYFSPENGFAGNTFDLLGRPFFTGTGRITAEDLLALNLLDVRVPPLAIRALLEERADEAAGFLARIEDVDIWADTAGESLRWANALWYWLRELDGVGWVSAGKILARLRPRLVPVVDSVVKNVLDTEVEFWRAMACPRRDWLAGEVQRVRDACGLEPGYPPLRVVDAAAWMLGSHGKNVRRLLEDGESRDPSFSNARLAFWAEVGRPDPAAAR